MADIITLPNGGGAKPRELVVDQTVLDALKDDLGITGSADDEWLARRINGAWARFEKFTARTLSVPPAKFADDWGEVASAYGGPNQPPVLAFGELGSPFLRCCPVISIDAVTSNGQTLDAAGVRFESKTGKLFTLQQPSYGSHDVTRELVTGRVRVAYTAGWDVIPPDLYEALLGVIGVAYGQRSAQAAGAGMGGIKGINVIDVGSVELSNEGNAFAAASMKGVRIEDPLLGPWTYLLQEYIDYRVQIGSPLIPTTVALPDPAP